jgi:5'-deoxynucleotidase YfbR-like HD superfamily hydrolase
MENRTVLRKRLQFILEGGLVQRFHTRPSLKPNTVAHHGNGVALLCAQLWLGDYGCLPRPHLLLAAATHDLAEQVTSDISAPAKRLLMLRDHLQIIENVALAEHSMNYHDMLTEEEQDVLGWADLFDAMLHCCHEVALGNKMMMLPYKRMRGYVQEIYPTMTVTAIEIYMAVQEIMQEYREEPQYDCYGNVSESE